MLPVAVYPKNITIPIGINVTIICTTNILGTVVYTWERRYAQTWAVVGSYNSTTCTTSRFGLYRCKVHNETSTAVSDEAVVIVHTQGVLEITDQLKRGFIKKGEIFSLTCNATGPGTLVYSWERKTAHKWITVSGNKTSYKTSSLGRYRCRVTNEAESITSKVAVIKYYSK